MLYTNVPDTALTLFTLFGFSMQIRCRQRSRIFHSLSFAALKTQDTRDPSSAQELVTATNHCPHLWSIILTRIRC